MIDSDKIRERINKAATLLPEDQTRIRQKAYDLSRHMTVPEIDYLAAQLFRVTGTLKDDDLHEQQTRIVTRDTIEVGPFSIFFSNHNKEMGLKGHSHYAEVSIVYLTTGSYGFPSFHETTEVIQRELQSLTEKPIQGKNEDIAHAIFDAIDNLSDPVLDRWGGDYKLKRIELAVRGVRDKIGHSDGFTRYRVSRVGI